MRRTTLLILVLALACAGEAHASASDVLRDCTDDGRLQRTYTQQELRQALATMPSDVDEYTDCRDVIRAAQLAGAGGSDGGAGSAGGGAGMGAGTPGDPDGGGEPSSAGAGAGDEEGANPPTGSTAGSFGGFSGFERDPLKAASAQERDAIERATATRPAAIDRGGAPFADADLPVALWIVLALGAAGLIVFAASDLRRRVHARRAV